jgi:hypothetical protein
MIGSLSTLIQDLSGTQDPDDRINSEVRLVENVSFKWNPMTIGEYISWLEIHYGLKSDIINLKALAYAHAT